MPPGARLHAFGFKTPAPSFPLGKAFAINLSRINRSLDGNRQSSLTAPRGPLPPEGVSDETPESLIPYDEIVQNALRAVVGRVLGEVEQSGGLPGEPSLLYYVQDAGPPGVSIPKHLLERFPDEMTIVIQHRFWDLKVEDDNFAVGLSFGGVPAALHVPFAAVTQFHDPAVEFALTFQANARRKSRRNCMKRRKTTRPKLRRPSRAATGRTSSAWTLRGRSDGQ